MASSASTSTRRAGLGFATGTLIVALSICGEAPAQTRNADDSATAYGARLGDPGSMTGLNPNRVNSRFPSRLETRLSLRIERYRPSGAADPASAFEPPATDNARVDASALLRDRGSGSGRAATPP